MPIRSSESGCANVSPRCWINPDMSAAEILGSVDALKLRSSLTLFRIAAPGEPLFQRALEQYFDGKLDPRTIELLETKSGLKKERVGGIPRHPLRLVLGQFNQIRT